MERNTYSSVNNLTGMFNPVDRIGIARRDLGILLRLAAPFLLDVSKLVVWVEDYMSKVSSHFSGKEDGQLTQCKYVDISIIELCIVLIQFIDASLEHRVEDRVLRVHQLFLPPRTEGLKHGDDAVKRGHLVR